jgi:MtrB/PioB family decaheme-associated outer membrane protein
MKLARAAGVLLAIAVSLVMARAAAAQTTLGGMNVEGSIEAGLRGFLTDEPKNKERAKFEEYRDMGAGPFLERLQLRFFTKDEGYSSELFGSKWGREDQEYSLSTGRLGLWQFQFDWDQTPHLLSTTGRTLLHETSRGVWVAPGIGSLSDFNGQATSRELHNIGVRWDTGHFLFKLTPTPDLDLTAEYTRTRREGNKPFSMSFGTGSGTNFLELLQPVDSTVHDFRLGGSIAREKWQLQFGYVLSVYDADVDRVRFDNPCFQAPVGGSAAFGCVAAESRGAANPIPARGQSALAPSNMAHTFNLAGGVNLPLRTRVTANGSYSLTLQNQDFLPMTINTIGGINTNPNVQLPQNSLNGNVQTILLNLAVTSRPFALPLTLSGKYRVYDYEDRSDDIRFRARVLNDRPLGTAAAPVPDFTVTTAKRESFTRHNFDLDGRYQVAQPVVTTLGFGWERWNRGPEREVSETDEYFIKAAIDVTPTDWLSAQLTYKPSFRRDSDYNRGIVSGTTPTTQLFLARKFDEAERDRQRVDLLVQITPVQGVSINPTAGWRHDDYIRSAFGLNWETAWSAGMDVGWNPVPRLSVSVGYMHELIDRDLRSRGASPNVASNINADWLSNMADVFDTFYGGVKVVLIPHVLDWSVNGNYAMSYGTIETRNPSATLPGTPLALSAQAKRMPAFDDHFARVDTGLRYHLSKSWTASVFYAFESFAKNDWRTDNWLAWNPILATTNGFVWLGNDLKDYNAHIIGATLTYRFK